MFHRKMRVDSFTKGDKRSYSFLLAKLQLSRLSNRIESCSIALCVKLFLVQTFEVKLNPFSITKFLTSNCSLLEVSKDRVFWSRDKEFSQIILQFHRDWKEFNVASKIYHKKWQNEWHQFELQKEIEYIFGHSK